MDFIKTLQSLEDAVFEIVMWTLLLPKTLFQIILKPNWIQDYITKEWEKKAEERFQDYLSPMIFWILLAVIPYAWVNIRNPGTQQLDDKLIINSAISLLFAPIVYTVTLQRRLHKQIDKVSIKRFFYIQFYCHAPIQLSSLILKELLAHSSNTTYFGPLLASSLVFLIGVFDNVSVVHRITALIILLWQLLLETLVFRQELGIGLLKSIGLVARTEFIIYLIASPFYVILTTIITAPPQ